MLENIGKDVTKILSNEQKKKKQQKNNHLWMHIVQ